MARHHVLGLCLAVVLLQGLSSNAQPGFLSIDCGAPSPYVDETGISWVPDTNYTTGGAVGNISRAIGESRPLQNLRYFTSQANKHCFSLGPVNSGTRYLVRATFLYGDYDGAETYPIFNISVDASPWATVSISNASEPLFHEFIAVAVNSTSFTVCLIPGSTGFPFISTLELRPMKDAMYSLSYLGTSFLSYTARINFGAASSDSLRYPDDPSDRIWVSDRVYPLQGEAPGTQNISTSQYVDVTKVSDAPPMKVMQTAALGSQGSLSYRLDLAGLPGNCYAVIYFAEIQDLGPDGIRSFNFESNINSTLFNQQSLDLSRDVGPYTAFEPGFKSVVIPQLVDFTLSQATDSNRGPLLNAMEIYQILPVVSKTDAADVVALTPLAAKLQTQEFAPEFAGDPCLPVPWDFLTCTLESPPRVSVINLSGRNLSGSIPDTIGTMSGLTELRLDNNQLSGTIPDLSGLTFLKILHLQSNELSGPFPSSLSGLNSLTEVFAENNNLTGAVPAYLLNRPGLTIDVSGNPHLCSNISCTSNARHSNFNFAAVVGGSAGGAAAVVVLIGIMIVLWKHHRRSSTKATLSEDTMERSRFPFQPSSSTDNKDLELQSYGNLDQSTLEAGARLFHLPELVDATKNFSDMIGSGGFGPVYYGKARIGDHSSEKEIAVKVLAASSMQGEKEFFNEVHLLSRIHHRNLVTLVGYCPDLKERMLVYEFLHRGSLRDHIHGSLSDDEPMDWLARLKIVLDAAKGIEYLHTGCHPCIIHRDVKSSNILISNRLVGKVADFGLSKLTTEDASAVSTTVRGTVGYLDPEYYISQQLTTKSDVFSFGVVLLEIMTGREPILGSRKRLGHDSNLVSWSRKLLNQGDVQSLVDPVLNHSSFHIESLWRLAELALQCVEPHGRLRPSMSQIVEELKEIIHIELDDINARPNVNIENSDDDSGPDFSETLMRPSAQDESQYASLKFDSSSNVPLHSGPLSELYRQPNAR